MSGGSKQNVKQNQKQFTDRTVTDEVTGIDPYQRQFATGYNALQGQFQNLIRNPAQLEYAPAFSNTLDPIVQNTVSQGAQAIKGQSNAANRALASQLSLAGTGNNSALLAALQRQGQMANQGSYNALVPAALQQQREFDINRQNILAQQNQTRLAGQNAQLQSLAGSMNLLQTLNQMAQLSAGHKTREVGTTKSKGSSYQTRSFI